MQTKRNNHELSFDEQIKNLQKEYNSNIKNKRQSLSKIIKLKREKNSEEEKEKLLGLYLKIQIPLTLAIGGVSILAGGLKAGLIGWGVLAAIQVGTSIAAAIKKNKTNEHINELEEDIFNEETLKDSYRKKAETCLTKARELSNPELVKEEEKRKEEEQANDTVFKIVMGEPIEIKRPLQYQKTQRKN